MALCSSLAQLKHSRPGSVSVCTPLFLSNGSVAVRLPVLPGEDAELSLSNITAFLLEERLLRPLRELGSLSPAAEYYRLKRRMMESPFERESPPLATH